MVNFFDLLRVCISSINPLAASSPQSTLLFHFPHDSRGTVQPIMDLTSENFSVHLPWLLNELSTSCFVSFDLELSGIPLGHPGQVPKDMSLAERYMEYKLAAEKYQILQLGLTICLEDPQEGWHSDARLVATGCSKRPNPR